MKLPKKSLELEKRNLLRKSRLPTDKDYINIHEEEKLNKKQTEYSQDIGLKKG